jgi:hypothetical protein
MKRERWHTKMYKLWLSLGGEEPKYKENLCRYVWIVLVRGPLRWFFFGRIKKVPPVAVAAVPLFTGGIVFTALQWPHFSLKAAEVLGVLLGICLVAVAVLIALMESYERWPLGFKKTFKVIGFPIWILPYLIDKSAKAIWKRIGGAVEMIVGAYIYGIKWPWLNPLGITIVAGIAALSYYATSFVVNALILIGFILCLILIVVLVLAIVVFLNKKWKEGAKDTVNLAREYVANKKQGSLICPFIEFE